MSRATQAPVVVVTGASSGIGLGVAASYASSGARLVLNARDPHKLARAAETLSGHAGLALVAGDIGSSGSAQRIVEAARERFGRIDVLINNAGIFAAKPLLEYSEAEIDGFLGVNLRGTILLTQAVVGQLRQQGGGGSIVNVTSAISIAPLGAVPASVPNASKGGLNAFTRSLALELAADGIRVNAVAPGLINTPLLGSSDDGHARLAPLQPMGHVGEVSDVVLAVRYLVDQPFSTGLLLTVDGGSSVGHW
jgi:NAD(P)-dependent dehydrogenase (short-subunit alcohol dehydrogenase family)